MLFPDPDQEISLILDLPSPISETPVPATLQATPTLQFHPQDTLPLRTSVILDHNGHAVPDGTPVRFIFNVEALPNSIIQETTTIEGVAKTVFTIPSAGALEIYVQSENARSAPMRIDILPSGELLLTTTNTPTPTDTETPVPILTPTPIAPEIEKVSPPSKPGILDWWLAFLMSGGFGLGVYQARFKRQQGQWRARASFLVFIGGMGVYSYLILGLPGSREALEKSVSLSVLLGTFCGCLIGLAIALSWKKIHEWVMQRNQSPEH